MTSNNVTIPKKETSTVTISTNVLDKLRVFVFNKHKKLRGCLKEHTEQAILDYISINEGL